MNQILTNAFTDELEKIATDVSEKITPAVFSASGGMLADPAWIVGKKENRDRYKTKKRQGLVKVSETAAGRRRRKRRRLQAITAGALASGAGYGSYKYLYPAIMKALGKSTKRPSNRAAAIASGLAGLSLMAMYNRSQGWANVNPVRIDKDDGRSGSSALPEDGSLAKRHKGHSSKVSPELLLPAAGGVLPLRDRRGLADSRDGDRDNNFRRGVDKYRYGGKKTRDYNFARPFRVRESGD